MRWRQIARRLGPVGMLGVAWLALPGLLGLYLVARLADVVMMLSSYGPGGIFIWTATMALCIGVGLLPVYSNTFLCGWAFGVAAGCCSAMVSYLLAAIIGYYLGRLISQNRIRALIDESDSARRIHRALLHQESRRSLLIIFLWRLSGSPFPFTNLVMASCGVPLRIYLLGTLCGLLPRVAIGTTVAATAARTGAQNLQSLVLGTQHPLLLALGAVGSLLILAVVGQVARTALNRVAGSSPETP